ncbi:MFS transporter [Pseudomonas putida]|uniref:MFS transporter n=1 Tax=Pseudomonas putida TaxID=303 RepID=UPI0018E6CD5F|nr:MFS transporter [Pseudomonas putida]MBI6944611.1 MFS transporter [Pseudomonas putida]MBI6960886.1 MFS transporter [Pseudomonas putida]
MIGTRMHRQVFLLACAQALFQTVSVAVMTVGGLAGTLIADRADLGTVPIASMFMGTAVAMFPASSWMARRGRRAGFLLGALLGVLGSLIAAYGVWKASLAVMAVGTFLIGSYQSFAQFYRFAASEVADDAFRPKAISLVLAGGVIAAILGPTVGRIGGPLLPTLYVGSFLILAVVSATAAVVLLSLRMPNVQADHADPRLGRHWWKVVSQPVYLVALFGAATGYGVMILAMTATPLAMLHHHHELSTASTVIQLHVLGMFLPSFFTGTLIARLGVLKVMLAGVVTLMAHVLMTWTGTSFQSFATSLVLLGVGWNFLYIGGTTLLTSSYTSAEKSRAQAINDMVIFAVGLSCSFGAASLLQKLDWQMLDTLLLPWLASAALAIFWFGWNKGRSSFSASGSIQR